MHLGRFQWIFKIILILFEFNQFQLVSGIHCGKFGFSCINKRSYKKCDVYKKSYVDNFVNLCPIKTFCNEEAKRACSPSGGNSSQDKEIKDIMSTQFSNKHKSTNVASNSHAGPSSTTASTATSCEDKSSNSSKTSISSANNSKKFKKPPSPIKAEKNALGKNGKSKTNSPKHIKGKNKHSRDVWNLDNNDPSFTFKDRDKHSPKTGINTFNLNDGFLVNSDSEKKDDTYNTNLRIRFTNKDSAKLTKQFICPNVGSFPIESDDSCFHVCLNRRRSAHKDLRAIKVCCPKSMYFDKISHRCEKRSSTYSNRNINWQRSRLRNRKFHRHETYHRNKIFK